MTEQREAVEIAERIRHGSLGIGTEDEPVTVSLGVAMSAPGVSDAETLVQDADEALYAAKAQGKNRTVAADG